MGFSRIETNRAERRSNNEVKYALRISSTTSAQLLEEITTALSQLRGLKFSIMDLEMPLSCGLII